MRNYWVLIFYRNGSVSRDSVLLRLFVYNGGYCALSLGVGRTCYNIVMLTLLPRPWKILKRVDSCTSVLPFSMREM